MNAKTKTHTKSQLNKSTEQLNNIYRTSNTPQKQARTIIQ